MTLLRLPGWVRGYLDEMLRFAERPNGRVCETADVADVAFAIRAHDDEIEMLTRAVAMLLTEGALTSDAGGLWLADFAIDQKNYEAERKRAYRATQRQNQNVPDAGGVSGTVSQDQRRSEERRIPLTPKGGRLRKRSEDPEETRRVRANYATDAKDGFYGEEVQRRAIAAARERGHALARLIDEIEDGQHPRRRPQVLLPPIEAVS